MTEQECTSFILRTKVIGQLIDRLIADMSATNGIHMHTIDSLFYAAQNIETVLNDAALNIDTNIIDSDTVPQADGWDGIK